MALRVCSSPPDAHLPDLPALDDDGGDGLGRRSWSTPSAGLDRLFDRPDAATWPGSTSARPTAATWPERPRPPPRSRRLFRSPGTCPLRRRGGGRRGIYFNPVAPRTPPPLLRERMITGPRPGTGQPDRRTTRDYMGGLVLPMAIDLGTTIDGRARRRRGRPALGRRGRARGRPARRRRPAAVAPAWARYVAGVVAEVRPARLHRHGHHDAAGRRRAVVRAALEVAVALGPRLRRAPPLELAEAAASGPSSGRRACRAGSWTSSPRPPGVEGHALLIDCRTLDVRPVPLPGRRRDRRGRLGRGPHAGRLAPTPSAGPQAEPPPRRSSARSGDASTRRPRAELDDPVLRRRARHVVTENARVLAPSPRRSQAGWPAEAPVR